tara:strand:- start:354 stop:1658 length:1305 start_codon:yes stop_codon:yes gene_type:complete
MKAQLFLIKIVIFSLVCSFVSADSHSKRGLNELTDTFKFDGKRVNKLLIKSLLESGEELQTWHSCLKDTSIEKKSAIGVALGRLYYSANSLKNCLTIVTKKNNKTYVRSVLGIDCKTGNRPNTLPACYSGYQIISQSVADVELSLTNTNQYMKSEIVFYGVALGHAIQPKSAVAKSANTRKLINKADSSFLVPILTKIQVVQGPGSYHEITHTIKDGTGTIVHNETYTLQYSTGRESCDSMSERLSHNWYMQEKEKIGLYFDSVSVGGSIEGTVSGEGEVGGVAGPIAIVGVGLELTGGITTEFTIDYRERVMGSLKDLTTKLRNDVRMICEISDLDEPPIDEPPAGPTRPKEPKPPAEDPPGAFDCDDMQATLDCVNSSVEYERKTNEGTEFITRTCNAYNLPKTSSGNFSLCACQCFETKKTGTGRVVDLER